jgi:hypothetical protein
LAHSLPTPGLVVVIQNRDGSQVDVVSPPPAPMIEPDPLAGQMGDLELRSTPHRQPRYPCGRHCPAAHRARGLSLIPATEM